MLATPAGPDTEAERSDVQAAAQAFGQKLIILTVSSAGELEPAFSTLVQRGAGALIVGTGAFANAHREQLAALAARHALPTSYQTRDQVEAGGLMSYGASINDAYRQVGLYAGRILKGEKPADLPVMRSNKFEFVINLKTARALGLEIPATLLATADEVIE
jgi:putative ABC transport system substrate-binding protein